MRFDVLLHDLRLFKSRSQAAAAISEGRALLDGAEVKPSRETRAGQRVTLRAGQIAIIPGNVPHGARVVAGDVVVTDNYFASAERAPLTVRAG